MSWVHKSKGHVRFPRRVNAGFMEVVNRGHQAARVPNADRVRHWFAAPGACAAVVAGIRLGWLDKIGRGHERWPVDHQLGRPRTIVMMIGPAVKVFDGEIEAKLPQL